MHILVTGAAGMIGRKLSARLVKDGHLNGHKIDRLTLIDVIAPEKPAGFAGTVDFSPSDLSSPGAAAKAVADRPEVIFHLAGVVSGEAETDFEKGYRVNLDGTRTLFEAIRTADFKPKVVFTSSIAVFGTPFPLSFPMTFISRPLLRTGRKRPFANYCSLTIRGVDFSTASASGCRLFACAPASQTRRPPAFSQASFENLWRARKRCYRSPILCGTLMQARVPRSDFLFMRR